MTGFQFTDLVLLIGTNPLPNYVVAKYCIPEHGVKRIWLVYTAQTETQMKNLSKAIHREFGIEPEPVSLRDETNPDDIKNDIESQILEGFREKHLHLNYTGGTKAMGIHVYRTIEMHLAGQNRCSFSYLSASTFRLTEDKKKISTTADLRNVAKIDFGTLFELHDYRNISPQSNYSFQSFQNATNVFSDLIERDELEKYYNEFDKSNFKKSLNSFITEFNRKKHIIWDKFPEAEIPGNIIRQVNLHLPERIVSEQGFFQVTSSNAKFIECAEYLYKNKWFEDYVFQALHKGMLEINTNIRIDKNCEIQGTGWGNNKFELDVILLNGYQFIGISCTTIGFVYAKDMKNNYAISNDKTKGELKEKGFEIILRTRQIGGDEARAILVTMAEPKLVDTLQKELGLETGSTINILVLGRRDLKEKKMVEKIKEFIGIQD